MRMTSSRRSFLRQAAAAGVSAAAFQPWLQLQALAQAASGAADGYKALVCLFLHGGNDGNNLLLPYEPAEYALYARGRTNLALPREQLLPVTPGNAAGRRFALHPSLPALRGLFERGQMALLSNIGPLVVPTTKAQYEARRVPLPANLFSHADQQQLWQTDSFSPAVRGGWGGRLMERVLDASATHRGYGCISLAGGGAWVTGDRALLPCRVPASGAFGFEGYQPGSSTDALSLALDSLMAETRSDPFEAAWIQALQRSTENQRVLTAALSGSDLPEGFPMDTELGAQLGMAARLIMARSRLGLNRQCFFCSIGGFDTHGQDQLAVQKEKFLEIDEAVAAFFAFLAGAGMASQVTLFTASDFGRTLVSNSGGSDHGWGNHQLVVGGAVQGGRLFGTFPDHTIGGPDDIGGGNWVPSLAIDQLGAELGRWFGAGGAALPEIFAQMGNFDTTLGLMRV